MQTKIINLERSPYQNNNNEDVLRDISEKKLLLIQKASLHEPPNFESIDDVPPLPPRTSVIFGSYISVSGDGHTVYKPVPPPKPLAQTPPPYRMPPFPPLGDGIPGTAVDYPTACSSPAQLHTHSSKFPIEREVILSNTDKNSKIPILNDFKKRSKGAIIAPDVPPKQMAAWTHQVQMQPHQILPDQIHPGLIQTIQQTPDSSVYRAAYHPATTDYYGSNAVLRGNWDQTKPAPRAYQPQGEELAPSVGAQQVALQVEALTQEGHAAKSNTRGVSKTYHAIKDIISGRFKGKESECKMDGAGLNNVAEDLRKSQANISEDGEKSKNQNEQAIYGQTVVQQHQYSQHNQHLMQHHFLAQQSQQYHQQQLKTQQQYSQLAQARSQEMLASRPDEQIYYQSYGNGAVLRSPQRFVQQPQNAREQGFTQVQGQMQIIAEKELPRDRQSVIAAFERRSAQQLERDNLKQRSFEARRTASQPQLSLDDEVRNETNNIVLDNKPQPQAAPSHVRRGSHGNIIEATAMLPTQSNKHADNERESDDGGFLKRSGSTEKFLDRTAKQEGQNSQENNGKVTEALQGTPRKKLEGEIGKIEGVYNVNSRLNHPSNEPPVASRNGPNTATKKGGGGSGASSDYDRAGGRNSSNMDSGRGSAAYSSGRRPPLDELHGTDADVGSGQPRRYEDVHDQGHDSEWVDIVENELRHILEPKLHELSLHGNSHAIANSTVSESISSMTPPLPPLSAGDNSSPTMTPKSVGRYKHSSLPYGSKPDYDGYKLKLHAREMISNSRYSGSSQKHRSNKKIDHNVLLRGKQIFGLDTTDVTSTTTRSLDLESMLDAQTDSDGEISATDARTIRKQLEGLENMYSEVLKLLGVNKRVAGRYQPSDPKFSKRRYGSMSSLPSSSVSSVRRERRGARLPASEDRRRGRDPRATARRFQRLEAHVVTLARSVAHLSSEMRTQHLVAQEMDQVRQEVAALRAQTNMLNVRSQSTSRAAINRELPTLANPTRVKKLTKFFGDEPPLVRLFLRKLGYEKYANLFENEKIGMVELPYLSEERLQKMGIPLGPRLRIMQEAQISVCKENTLCIV